MRTIVYIDGFNLYYRMLEARPALKWVDPKKLAATVLNPDHTILRVNYYTARVSARAHNPNAPSRQAVYLNALSAIPGLVIHEGSFMITEPWMGLARPPQSKPDGYEWAEPIPEVVKVIKFEEKGSDVNLGSHLVRDAFLDAFDVAVVLTNDSDLVEPIRVAIKEAGKRVGLLAPVNYPNQSLLDAASFYLHVRVGHLAQAQLPPRITLDDGTQLERPAEWA
jgi:uncharacterized LabA/DUF88 family protein